MAAVFQSPVQQDFHRPQPPRRDSSTRSERAERRNSQGLQASSPPSAASPVLTQNTQTSHYQPPRSSHLQGIENALAMSLAEIPPYNPSKRNSGQKQAPSQQAIPSTPLSSYSIPAYAYPSPTSVPRPGTSSSTRSNSSADSRNAQSSRQPATHQTAHRPASTTVVPIPQTPEQYASSQRKEAATTGARSKADRNTHQIIVNAPHTTGHANPEQAQGMGIYQPPPNSGNNGRPKIFFGPYQLLQTLGEGEFGKVKLGVRGDTRWGEEVAIKLIKRGSVEESATRMTKVNREIDVLRIVKHPNIVRLHDVIQTERYIGIVLEYASGGELFDHILAHRYLKDRDASKLFAQLISGVAYLHAKKIIHRDLKLENLLLDRNRNIIITDFGFANRYEEKGNDLMATSCGSPCYAAPELVVQDGKYVGSAVDVWSCGVILYAMLAGYLPFDDDPLNPDSENINLLYKYIINTPLSFPEWITPEPRDLLQKMLVPDPNKRCTLQDVAQHRWLRKYASLFDRTVEDLEGLAADQDEIKRQMLERQRDAVLYQEQAAHMTRSQTTAGMRPQSAMVTSSSMQASFAPSASASTSGRPGPSTSSNRRAHAYSAIVVPTVASQPEPVVPAADPFAMSSSQSHSAIPMSVSVSAPPRAETEEEQYQAALASQQDRKRIPSGEQEMPKAKSQRTATPDEAEEREKERKSKAKAHRYTVQVEYVPEQTSTRDLSKDAIMEQPVQTSPLPLEEKSQAVSEPAKIKELPEPIATVIEEPTPAESSASLVPSISVAEDHSPTSDSAAHSFDPPQSAASSSHADLGHSSSNLPPQPLAATVLPEKSTTPPASPKAEEKRPEKAVPFPPSPEQKRSKPLNAPAANEQVQRTASNSSRPPSSAASVSSKHRKAGSSDRFSISRFLGGSTTSLDKQARRGPLESSTASAQKEPFDEVTNKRKGGRRKAFSLVVEPFKPASSGASVRSGKRSSVRVQEGSSGSTSSRPTTERPRTRSSVALETTPAQGAVMSPPPRNLAPSITSTRRDPSSASTAISTDPSWVSSGPPAGKAKRVMDWFRWKSMPRDSGLASSQGPSAISTDFDRNTNLSASSRVTRASAKRQENLQHDQPAPSLVVTQTPADEPTGLPASPSTVTSLASQAPVTQAPVSKAPAASERPGPLIPVTDVQRAASVASNRTGSLEAFTEARLRFHQGAVDQNALTYRHPPAVLIDIRKILWAMGIDVREEAGPFRLKCTRRSSKKVAASHGVSVNAVTSGSLASSLGPGSLGNSTSIGPASSERLDGRTGLPASPHMGMTSSPSSTFKAFFGRRSSTNSVHQQAGMPSPALSTSTTAMDSPDLLLSPPGTSSATMGDSVSAAPLPYYGKTDSGAEVRFTVELSRMKNLPKLYAVDVRRLKGELWAYRGIYNAILERLELGE